MKRSKVKEERTYMMTKEKLQEVGCLITMKIPMEIVTKDL